MTPGGTKRSEQERMRGKDDEQRLGGRQKQMAGSLRSSVWQTGRWEHKDINVLRQFQGFLCLHCWDIIFPMSGFFALIHHTWRTDEWLAAQHVTESVTLGLRVLSFTSPSLQLLLPALCSPVFVSRLQFVWRWRVDDDDASCTAVWVRCSEFRTKIHQKSVRDCDHLRSWGKLEVRAQIELICCNISIKPDAPNSRTPQKDLLSCREADLIFKSESLKTPLCVSTFHFTVTTVWLPDLKPVTTFLVNGLGETTDLSFKCLAPVMGFKTSNGAHKHSQTHKN